MCLLLAFLLWSLTIVTQYRTPPRRAGLIFARNWKFAHVRCTFVRKRRIRDEIKRLPLYNIIRGSSIFIAECTFDFLSLLSSSPFSSHILQHEPDEYTSRQRWLVSSPGYENTVIESSFLLFSLIFSRRHFHYLCLCRDICHDYSVRQPFSEIHFTSVEWESEDLGCYMKRSW